MSAAAEIVFDRVSKRYPGREQQALHELSLEIPAGTFCVLVGPLVGGVAGILLYDLVVHPHLLPEDEATPPGRVAA